MIIEGGESMKGKALFAAFLVLLAGVSLGYFSPGAYGQLSVTTDQFTVPIAPNRDDVKAIGMGNTQIAVGTRFNAMMYNPALLSHGRVSYEVPGIQAMLPTSTFDAIGFLSDPNTIKELRTGDFLKRIRRGFDQYVNAAGTAEDVAAQQAAAIGLMNSGLRFVNEMQDKVIGPTDDPKLQGISFIPSFQVQIDHWGFALYGILQSGFQSFPTEALSRLYSLRIPENLNSLSVEQQLDIALAILPLFDQNLNLRYQQAIPTTFAVAYLDIVGAVGYGYQVNDALSLGANLKLVNRRVSTNIINSEHYDHILREIRSNFSSSKTGVTLDLGALYEFRKIATSLGLSLQNIIPMPTLNSTAVLHTLVYTQPEDQSQLPVAQTLTATLPFEFKVPFLANIGAMHSLTPNWDVALDWVDVASQDDAYEEYIERFRLGTEYRLEVAPGSFGAAFRLGLANKRFAGGLGLSFWRVFQLDGAYAFDHFIGDNAFFAQVRFGW